MADPQHDDQIARYADMMAALARRRGSGSCAFCCRRIPYGLVVGEIGSELGIPPRRSPITSKSSKTKIS